MAELVAAVSAAVVPLKDAASAVAYATQGLASSVSERRRAVACQRRNRYVSALLSPMRSSGTLTLDMLVDGLSDQQILSFRSHGKPEDRDAVAVAWVLSLKVLEALDGAFSLETGLPKGTFKFVLDEWADGDLDVADTVSYLSSYLEQEETEKYPEIESFDARDFAQVYFGNANMLCSGWSFFLLPRDSLMQRSGIQCETLARRCSL
jgi:hypothetical protein